jgi:hypothetical protein
VHPRHEHTRSSELLLTPQEAARAGFEPAMSFLARLTAACLTPRPSGKKSAGYFTRAS